MDSVTNLAFRLDLFSDCCFLDFNCASLCRGDDGAGRRVGRSSTVLSQGRESPTALSAVECSSLESGGETSYSEKLPFLARAFTLSRDLCGRLLEGSLVFELEVVEGLFRENLEESHSE